MRMRQIARSRGRDAITLAVVLAASGLVPAAAAANAKTFTIALNGTFARATTGTSNTTEPACSVTDTRDERADFTIAATKPGGSFNVPTSAQFDLGHVRVTSHGSLKRT